MYNFTFLRNCLTQTVLSHVWKKAWTVAMVSPNLLWASQPWQPIISVALLSSKMNKAEPWMVENSLMFYISMSYVLFFLYTIFIATPTSFPILHVFSSMFSLTWKTKWMFSKFNCLNIDLKHICILSVCFRNVNDLLRPALKGKSLSWYIWVALLLLYSVFRGTYVHGIIIRNNMNISLVCIQHMD